MNVQLLRQHSSPLSCEAVKLAAGGRATMSLSHVGGVAKTTIHLYRDCLRLVNHIAGKVSAARPRDGRDHS